MGGDIHLICASEKQKYFCERDWTGSISLKRQAKLAFWRRPFPSLRRSGPRRKLYIWTITLCLRQAMLMTKRKPATIGKIPVEEFMKPEANPMFGFAARDVLPRCLVPFASLLCLALISPALAADEPDAPKDGAAVTVLKAAKFCFPNIVEASGIIVPREETVVRPDRVGLRVADI